MERKVKSLIPIKSKNESLLTSLLLLVGGLLCVGAIGLLASSLLVKASTINQEGIENKSEAIYKMEFAKTGDLENPLNYMYLSGSTFYISGAGIFVDGNSGTVDKNINILGGTGNNVKSENVTVIGGKGNSIMGGYGFSINHPTILGGIGNYLLSAVSNVNNFVLVGGIGNKTNSLTYFDNSAILGGEHNLLGGNYSFILGGSGNGIYAINTIVGGLSVQIIGGKSNIFAFSDGSIDSKLQSNNAFYLIVGSGVGLGMQPLKSGLTSKGAVKIGTIDISTTCGSNDIGVMGTWTGCMVGCTKKSNESGGKWELIDHGSECREKCKGNPTNCIVSDHFDQEIGIDRFPSKCVGNVDTGNAIQCASNLVDKYANVSYEIKLIPNSQNCPPATDDNKCVFKCDAAHPNVGPSGCTSEDTKICGTDSIHNNPGDGPGVCKGNSTYVGSTNKVWTYKSNSCGNLNPCEWSCSDGYIMSENGCDPDNMGSNPDPVPNPDPKCSGTEPTGVGVVKGPEGIGEWRPITSGTPGTCEWKCSNGYIRSGFRCILYNNWGGGGGVTPRTGVVFPTGWSIDPIVGPSGRDDIIFVTGNMMP